MRNNNIAQSIKFRMESGETVTALNYARTSTDNDEQKDSCDNQVAMCSIYLKRYPNVKLAEKPYVDQGISGKSDIGRKAFEDMLERVKQGDIDLIIVKTKARLCRSKALATMLEEMMRDYKFSILTLSDGQIYDNTDRSSRLINGIKDVIDEDYVWGQSEYGKMTHALRCERKLLTSINVTFGYQWNKDTKSIEINEEEAKTVKMIYEWYVYHDYGIREISRKLAELGIYGKNSRRPVTAATLMQWLTNESYIGVFHINKKGSTLDLGAGRETKRFTNPKEEWIAVQKPDLAIIDKELFDLAQKIRTERRTTYDKPSKEATQARFRGFHLFAGKVFCGACGTQFVHVYADRAQTISAYKDYFSKKAKEVGEKCENNKYNKIHEMVLSNITKKAINLTLENTEQIFDNLYNIISEALASSTDNTSKVNALKKKLDKLEKECESYFEGWRTAPDNEMREYFYKKITSIKEEIAELKQELSEYETDTKDSNQLQEQLKEVKEQLTSLQYIETLDRTIVDNFVDKIVINPDGNLYMTLKTGPKFMATVPDYNTVAASIRKGEAVRYIKNIKSLVHFSQSVSRLFIRGMTGAFRPGMQIRLGTCLCGLRQWCLWAWIYHLRQSGGRLRRAWT